MVSSYESTPAEIKIAILNNVTDIASLKALTHACPTTHALYTQNRERLLTQATMKELWARQLDIFTFAPLLEVRSAQNRNPDLENLEAGLRSLQHHISRYGEVRDTFALSVEQCRALRNLVDAVRWRWIQSWSGHICPIYYNKPSDTSPYWLTESDELYTVVIIDILPSRYQGCDQMTPNEMLDSDMSFDYSRLVVPR